MKEIPNNTTEKYYFMIKTNKLGLSNYNYLIIKKEERLLLSINMHIKLPNT